MGSQVWCQLMAVPRKKPYRMLQMRKSSQWTFLPWTTTSFHHLLCHRPSPTTCQHRSALRSASRSTLTEVWSVHTASTPTEMFLSSSQSVNKQGPVLAARLSTSQAHCRQAMHTTVGRPRGKKVAKTNAERCELYRTRQKSKKEKGEEELRMLDAKNRALKANEAAIRKKVHRMKEALLRMGLGN